MSRASSRTKSTIYISGLDPAVTEEALQYAFIPFGDIVEIQLPKDVKTKEKRGFAFIEYETPADAESAIDNMNLSELNGKTMRVSVSKPQKETFDITDAKVAVWNQEQWLQEHAVDESDRRAIDEAKEGGIDPMEALENAQ
ncbi:hypothetical protein V1512DRAFT_260260 [Lipomyces arxii]|uniref:uncharacterized protein n=1 Tax=Lipomyces arxii TaxID=56418 RepID=UPI0034CD7CDB